MEAGARKAAVAAAAMKIVADDSLAVLKEALNEVFSKGYGYGLRQGHYDRDHPGEGLIRPVLEEADLKAIIESLEYLAGTIPVSSDEKPSRYADIVRRLGGSERTRRDDLGAKREGEGKES